MNKSLTCEIKAYSIWDDRSSHCDTFSKNIATEPLRHREYNLLIIRKGVFLLIHTNSNYVINRLRYCLKTLKELLYLL